MSHSSDDKKVIRCINLGKEFTEGDNKIEVLNNINFSISAGEYAAIIGRSGSGKTTLLHMLAGLDTPTSGSVEICGQAIADLSGKARGLLRNKHIGFVYQFHHLLPEFSALENVMIPMLIAKAAPAKARREAQSLLAEIGLGDRLAHKPAKLSGGERQRVAIARALINHPDCVLADEPTGNLDSHSSALIHELMMSLNQSQGISFLVVTHDMNLAKQFQKVYTMDDGKLSEG